jgi:hypothetical protein
VRSSRGQGANRSNWKIPTAIRSSYLNPHLVLVQLRDDELWMLALRTPYRPLSKCGHKVDITRKMRGCRAWERLLAVEEVTSSSPAGPINNVTAIPAGELIGF